MSLLYLTILLNFLIHQDPSLLEDFLFQSNVSSWWGYGWHSHSYTTMKSMLLSLFSHADWEHVLSNMFLLWMVGKQLFVTTYSESASALASSPSRIQRQQQERYWLFSSWTSPLFYLWIYFGSQILAVAGCRVISHGLDREWERRVYRDRASWSWKWVPYSWRDAWYTVTNAQQAVELRVWQYTPMIGSSAAVFGVVGAHVYAALFCRDHPAGMDSKAQMLWLIKVGMELARTPFSLDHISLLDKEDNIDHASHLCGFVGGFFLAVVWDFLSRKWTSNPRRFE